MASLAYDPFATSGRSAQVFTKTLIYLILAAFAFYYLLPLVVVFANSFRELDDISRNGERRTRTRRKNNI